MFIEDIMGIKNRRMIITGTIVCLFIILLITIKRNFDFGKIVFINDSHEIVNEIGKIIPSRIIVKKTKKNHRNEPKSKEYFTIIFEEIKEYDGIFVLFIKDSVFGIPQGGKEDYINVFGNIVYQKSKVLDFFKILYNKENYNDFFNDEFNKPLISNLKFLEDGVEFDTYGELKKYGSKIIIRKKNNQ